MKEQKIIIRVMKNDNLYYKWSTRLSKVKLFELKPCCIFV